MSSFCGSKVNSKDTFEYQNKKNETDRKRIDDSRKGDVRNYLPWAIRMNEDAQEVFNLFSRNLKNIFKNTCDYADVATNNILPEGQAVGNLKMCLKSDTSLAEKMASDSKEDESSARANIQDAIRARVVLKHGTKAEGDKICEQLTDAVSRGKLEIKEIINYYSDDEGKYISDKSMNALKTAIDNRYGEDSYTYHDKVKSSGYNSVHIVIKVNKDFDAELQIMGREVERLKDVEDVFYKLRHNKNTRPEYRAIKRQYRSMYSMDNTSLINNLNAYTREAYIAQREKELGIYKGKEKTEFVPLDTKKHNLPKIFDFNKIAEL